MCCLRLYNMRVRLAFLIFLNNLFTIYREIVDHFIKVYNLHPCLFRGEVGKNNLTFDYPFQTSLGFSLTKAVILYKRSEKRSFTFLCET